MFIQIIEYKIIVYLCVIQFIKMKKDETILIRVSTMEKRGLERAAEIAGIGLSAWARLKLRSAAIKEHQDAGERVIFLEPIKLKK